MTTTTPTTPASEFAPRAPTTAEKKQLDDWLKTAGIGYEDNWIDTSWIAVFDHYQTDCPGYCGKLIYLIWGGSPCCFNAFIEEHGKLIPLDPDDE